MNLREITKTIGAGRIPPQSACLLEGAFAFSHRGEFESPNSQTGTPFIPQTQAGYLIFDGTGGVNGKIMVNRGGGAAQFVTPSGTYSLSVETGGIVTGTIETTSSFDSTTNIKIEYFIVLADNGRDMKYAVQKASVVKTTGVLVRTPKVLVWGTMRKIYP